MRFGSHVSIQKGYYHAALTAYKMDAGAFQYFPKNPRSLKVKDFDRQDALRCSEFSREHGLQSIAHTPYPVSLIPAPEKENEIMSSILNDLEIAEACGSLGIVAHFGAYRDPDPLEAYKRMIAFLDDILAEWEGNALLLIENNAGKSGAIGTTMEEHVQIRKLCDFSEKIGFCLDTCHAFASGIWTGDNWGDVEQTGLELDYFQHLKAIHLNNSVYASGSMKDRHANIFSGQLTSRQFEELLCSPYLQELPMILETPTSADYSHKQEIIDLRNLVSKHC
ncbi:deoxyribonuclease IV [Bacillus marinisedimentorum]|uniref:deoxyribonuclease IV n=1 Tax=Bacillus marinisedimentorum TaxID=1821260 RepID=UPI000871CB4C|nr:deoxyribonuclease IV [Bacillus marinisedimentorum]